MQFLSISLSGRKRLKTGKSGKHKEIRKIQARRTKTKLRIAFETVVNSTEISPIRNGSLETREDLTWFKIVSLIFFLG